MIRDNRGSILGAGVDRICGNFDVECAETLAIRFSLSFSKECGFNNILIESDNLRVISRLTKLVPDNSYLSAILQDCCWIANSFESVIYSHVGREGNKVAHGLAELAQGQLLDVWLSLFLTPQSC